MKTCKTEKKEKMKINNINEGMDAKKKKWWGKINNKVYFISEMAYHKNVLFMLGNVSLISLCLSNQCRLHL